MSTWGDHAVLWHVYPLGFTGAEQSSLPAADPAVPRLRQLTGWLDYAVELGCSGLLLGPVFASETHGYDTVDHFRIDPRLGDEDDFDALARAASQRGLRLILDGVFNHVGRGFPAFQAAVHGGEGTPAARWFKRDGDDFAAFEGHSHLVELDHNEPAVLGYVTEVMRYWLGRGAGGWRLDAAYAVPPGFWAKALPVVRAGYPDAWILGEMIHGDYAAYASEAGLDAVTQYEVWKAIWSSLNDRNFFELDHALGRHNAFMDDGLMPQTFVGNHDVTRIASALDDIRHLGHALAVLFCAGGVPSVYYGDEQAFRGVKEHRPGGDDEIRPMFPATPAELLPDGWPVYRLHQRLIGFRRRHPWLVRARTSAEELGETAMALRVRGAGDGQHILLLLNTGDTEHTFGVDAGGLSVAVTPSPDEAPASPLTVPPHSWTILALCGALTRVRSLGSDDRGGGPMAGSVTTFLMFEGQAEEAMTFYTSLFKDGKVLNVDRYGVSGPGPEGTVKAARFSVAGRDFMCSDSFVHHDFTFTPSVSLYVECEDEQEIDDLYGSLGDGGAALMPLADYGFGSKFGWVNDRFGVSWQLCLP